MLKVVDLFAGESEHDFSLTRPPNYTAHRTYTPRAAPTGLGGFAAGAIEASGSVEGGTIRVVLGVDNDPVPLKLWAANVGGGARIEVATLGPDGDPLPELPPAAKDVHVHASTPCTVLSNARQSPTATDVTNGVAMLRWAIDLFLSRGDHSWSLENVSTPTTRKVLEEYRTQYPDRVAFATMCASEFGACQTRIRLIAGPPALIKRLQEMPASKRYSVRESFERQGLEIPAPCFKNQTTGRDGAPCVRSVEQQSHTVCASHPLTWTSCDGVTVRVMSPCESAALMGFPPSWRLPKGSRAGQRAVGNALCVAMSKAISQAALSLSMDVPMPLPDTPPSAPTEATVANEHRPASTPGSNKRPRTSPTEASSSDAERLCAIEALLRELHAASRV